MSKKSVNFTSSKVLKSATIHVDITDIIGDMYDWVEERSDQTLPEIHYVTDCLDHYVTRIDGEAYFAREHINRFRKLVASVAAADGEDHPDAQLLARLTDLSGRKTRNGGEIRAIRRRRNRGENV